METFATARLRASKLSLTDRDDLVALHLDPEVSRFLGGVRSPEATDAYIDTGLRHWADHGVGLWTLRDEDGAFTGRAALRYIELEDTREFEIAYALARDAWGRGLATEIATALVELWRTRCDPPELVGVVVKGNAGSETVLRKAGFAYERDARFHDADCGVFRLKR
ncbi:GNAT family N-acetyltransferase [Caulobacter sp. RL271]|jgi:RimJ/RimL family protein N-acetyltransferase|uniref:GNAT family N-acetyltransferase n=1 Tax=Caulobacter segnis TaxID=88688 RepID=A0ABY4ZWE7_9CAUL|nr:GNAT family N-acetyltransferase [Caulobacter segnis]USQ96312.1 GNAT family N-acetyltransferase [Caulobacter segnis]